MRNAINMIRYQIPHKKLLPVFQHIDCLFMTPITVIKPVTLLLDTRQSDSLVFNNKTAVLYKIGFSKHLARSLLNPHFNLGSLPFKILSI
jgi:hypothetical protein